MRTIIITGASGGLAQEMVKLLPEDRLILLGRNQEKLENLYANHPQTECIGIDITDPSAVQQLVEELYQRYGRQYRQHGGLSSNSQIQPLFGHQVCGHWLL